MLIAPDPERLVWIDGAMVPWRDAAMSMTAHHYGVGVFEGLRLYPTDEGPAIFRLESHTERLLRSAHILDMPVPYSRARLALAQEQTVRENKAESAYLRPFVYYDGINGLSPSVSDLTVHVAILCIDWQLTGHSKRPSGLRVKTATFRRSDPGNGFLQAKANANYMTSIMALKEARAGGADDALLLDANGFVAEGTGANVFIVRDGTLLTPPLTAALPGITRATVLALAEELQIPARETYFTRDEGYVADEAFFTGTAAEITPIIEIDGRKIGSGQRGPITARLSDLYNDIVRGRSKTHRDWLTIIA